LDHDLSEKNLKDAFIESIRPHKLLFNEASRMGTQNVTVLIATLSDWLMREQQKCTDVLNAINDLDEGEPSKRKKMIPEESADQAKPREGNFRNPPQANGRNMNQAVKAFLTMFEDASKAHPETQSGRTHPLAPLTGPGTNRDVECNQCGNWWERGRKNPCQPVCKYSRHPKFKARPKNVPWPKNEPALTYKGVPYDQIDEETKRGWDRTRNLKAHPGSQPEYRRDRA
jgi:rubrerythrin